MYLYIIDNFQRKNYKWPTNTGRCAVKEITIKTPLRFHQTPERRTIFKNPNNNVKWCNCYEKQNSLVQNIQYRNVIYLKISISLCSK
jgi:hypothetical protein